MVKVISPDKIEEALNDKSLMEFIIAINGKGFKIQKSQDDEHVITLVPLKRKEE